MRCCNHETETENQAYFLCCKLKGIETFLRKLILLFNSDRVKYFNETKNQSYFFCCKLKKIETFQIDTFAELRPRKKAAQRSALEELEEAN